MRSEKVCLVGAIVLLREPSKVSPLQEMISRPVRLVAARVMPREASRFLSLRRQSQARITMSATLAL